MTFIKVFFYLKHLLFDKYLSLYKMSVLENSEICTGINQLAYDL